MEKVFLKSEVPLYSALEGYILGGGGHGHGVEELRGVVPICPTVAPGESLCYCQPTGPNLIPARMYDKYSVGPFIRPGVALQ